MGNTVKAVSGAVGVIRQPLTRAVKWTQKAVKDSHEGRHLRALGGGVVVLPVSGDLGWRKAKESEVTELSNLIAWWRLVSFTKRMCINRQVTWGNIMILLGTC